MALFLDQRISPDALRLVFALILQRGDDRTPALLALISKDSQKAVADFFLSPVSCKVVLWSQKGKKEKWEDGDIAVLVTPDCEPQWRVSYVDQELSICVCLPWGPVTRLAFARKIKRTEFVRGYPQHTRMISDAIHTMTKTGVLTEKSIEEILMFTKSMLE